MSKKLTINYGVSDHSEIKKEVKEIEEATKDLDFDDIHIEIGIAPKPIIDDYQKFEEE